MIGSVEELRRYLHTTAGGGAQADDVTLLGDLLAAASDRFKSLVPDRTLEPTVAPETKTIRARGRVVRLPDLREGTLTALAIDGQAITTPPLIDLDLEGRGDEETYLILRLPSSAVPAAAIDVMYPVGNTWESGTTARRRVSLTGHWGPPVVLPRVKEAVLIWAARVYHERAARWSDARQDPDGGVASYFRSIPPSIQRTADDLRMPAL